MLFHSLHRVCDRRHGTPVQRELSETHSPEPLDFLHVSQLCALYYPMECMRSEARLSCTSTPIILPHGPKLTLHEATDCTSQYSPTPSGSTHQPEIGQVYRRLCPVILWSSGCREDCDNAEPCEGGRRTLYKWLPSIRLMCYTSSSLDKTLAGILPSWLNGKKSLALFPFLFDPRFPTGHAV